MPCDTITTAKLDLTKANNEVLISILVALGFNINTKDMERITASNSNTNIIWTRTSGLSVRTRGSTAERWADKIQTTYTSQVIQTTAKRFGWQVKQLGNDKYQVIRR